MQNDDRNNSNNNQGGVTDFSGYNNNRRPNNSGNPNNSNNSNNPNNPNNPNHQNNLNTPNGRIVYDEYGNAYLVDSHGNAVRVNIQNANQPQQGQQPRPQQGQQQPQRTQQGQQPQRQQGQPQQSQRPQQEQQSRQRPSSTRTRDTRDNNRRRKPNRGNNHSRNNRDNRNGRDNNRDNRNNANRQNNNNQQENRQGYDQRQNQTGERGEYSHYNSRPEKPRKRRKKHHIFSKIIMAILVVAILSQVLLLRYVSKVKQVEPKPRYDVTADIVSDKVENILVIGSDTRDAESAGRTDSMMLFSFNRQTKTMTTTSFMRDMYVEIPNHGWDKLNAAYAYGGAELLMDTLTMNFGIDIDGYLYIDFYSFIDIVDAVGGIDVEISDEEAQGMTAPMAEQNKILGNKKGTDYLTSGGNLHLNGNQALAYSRLRYVGNADFERTQRQRLVVSKILEKSKKLNPFALDRFLATACKSLSSDMNTLELMGTADRGILYLTYKQENLRIPAEGTYSFSRANGQSILSVDFDANKNLIRESIYNN